MIETKPAVNSLVLYKIRPARVVRVDDKIEIELAEGKNKRVRPRPRISPHRARTSRPPAQRQPVGTLMPSAADSKPRKT